ncbi:MAG: glycoside hydrolase family 3 protein [Clostridia bacterium]|nr:glycoside hydrolase family 3 protein [Clostridia bacterium]
MKKSTAKRVVAGYGIFLTCVFASMLTVTNVLANTYSEMISTFLQQETMKKVEVENAEDIDTRYFKSKFSKQSELYNGEIDFAKRVQAEGSVLLQNKGLPIAKKGKVTLLGSGISKEAFLVCGGGSGSIDTAKTPTLKEVFEDAEFEVNPVMWNYYTSGNGKSTRGTNTVGEAGIAAFTAAETDSCKNYNDAAIVVIGRLGAEDADVATTTTENSEKSMLELSDNELALIDYATEHFKNVVVLLNTLNAIETGPLMDRDVSVLWVGAAGQQGLRAIPEVLNGTYNPSGKLVDTYVYDNFSAPAMVNFGNFTFGNAQNEKQSYLIYQEGIYVGYRYYETRYEDKVCGASNVGDYQYASTVAYPFGYGLSYTTFSHSVFAVRETSSEYKISVNVKNEGSVAGKDVVEVYLQKPYRAGSLVEISAVELVGFEKTNSIEAGESETVTVSVPKESLRSYDTSANGGKGGYVVAEGTYFLSVGTDAHDALNNILAEKGKSTADGMTENGDASFVHKFSCSEEQAAEFIARYNKGENGEVIQNELSDIDVRAYDSSFQYLSRNNWTGTWPTADKKLNATDRIFEDMGELYPVVDEKATMPTTGKGAVYGLVDMKGLDYDSPYWDDLLDQLSVEDMKTLIGNGGYGTPGIASIAKNKVLDKDGPAGISATLIGGKGTFGFPVETLIATTWNKDLAKEMGHFIGEDALLAGVSGWYAPGLNTHRTPFSGRNFEYYSEDGFLAGIFGAEVTLGAQEMGVYTYSKHFAFNDEELNRQRVCVFSNEQAGREIYLKPFELNVRIGHSHGIMVSMNRIGGTWTGAHRGMVTNILRGEWGFEGCVVTDSSSIGNQQRGLYGGTDLWLGSSAYRYSEGFETNPAVVSMMRNACHNILFAIANSNAMNGIAPGATFVEIMPLWKVGLIVADVVLYAACAAGVAALVYFGMIKVSKEEN